MNEDNVTWWMPEISRTHKERQKKGIQQGNDKSNRHCNLQTIVFKSKKWQDAMNSSEMLTDLSNH